MDLMTINGAIQSLQLGAQAVNGLLTLKIGSEVREKAVELNGIILSAQSQMLTMQTDYATALKKIDALEAEVMRLKSISTERENYQLHQVGVGAITYILKPTVDSSEVAHWLCVKCFDSGTKSVLQNSGRTKDRGSAIYKCGTCQSSINVHWNTRIKRLTAEDIDRQTKLLSGESVD